MGGKVENELQLALLLLLRAQRSNLCTQALLINFNLTKNYTWIATAYGLAMTEKSAFSLYSLPKGEGKKALPNDAHFGKGESKKFFSLRMGI